jgi:hypothetical protein
MRQVLWVGLLGCGLALSACAGPGERPTTADYVFPIPWVLKQRSQAPAPSEVPPEMTPHGKP